MLWISTWIYILGCLPVRLIYLKDRFLFFFFLFRRKKKKTLGNGVRAMMHGWNLRKHLPTSNSVEMIEWREGKRGSVKEVATLFQRAHLLHWALLHDWKRLRKTDPSGPSRGTLHRYKLNHRVSTKGNDSRAKYVKHPWWRSSFHHSLIPLTDSFHQHPLGLRLSTLNYLLIL